LGAASILALMLGAGTMAASATDSVPSFVSKAIAEVGRPGSDFYRDKVSMPAAVMAFAGIKPGMAVADVMPGNGYWTRIISGIVGPKGNAYMFVIQGRAAKPEKDPNQNDPYSRIVNANAVVWQPEFHANTAAYWDSLNAFPEHFNMPKQLDATFTADYATMKAENPKWDMVEGNKSIFRATKNGGLYIVIGEPGAANPLNADQTKQEITAAGFTLAGETNAGGVTVLKFQKPANAPNTDMRPKSTQSALGTLADATRGSNPGLIRRADTGPSRERHVVYHTDMTYQEWGQRGSGNNPHQSGTWFFNADGGSCMQHLFPTDQQGFVNCQYNLSPNNLKTNDLWMEGDAIYRFIGPGKVYFKDEDASDGGTLGDTPAEKAREFGKIVAFGEKNGAKQTYLDEFLRAYYHLREESKADPMMLDTEFQAGYGKPVPARPAPPAKRGGNAD
jgi:predicted methyltransferase